MTSTDSATIVCGEEDFDAALPEILALFNQTRSAESAEPRFRWLYGQNPHGPAQVWGLRNRSTGQLVGFTACLPRRILVDGQVRTCWNGVDFSIDRKYRTLGPAARLRRQARLAIDAGKAEFLYAHPNDRMATVHRMAGHEPIGRMFRMARPLRLAEYAGPVLRSRLLGKMAGLLLDPGYDLIHRGGRRAQVALRHVPGIRFDQRFDELFSACSPARKVVGVRDSTYLNWRYAANPLYATDAILAEDDTLRGYLLITPRRGLGYIYDLFPTNDPPLARALLAAAVRLGRALHLKALSMTLLEKSELLPVLAQMGFRLRPDLSQMFVYAPEGCGGRDFIRSAESWVVSTGDRDE